MALVASHMSPLPSSTPCLRSCAASLSVFDFEVENTEQSRVRTKHGVCMTAVKDRLALFYRPTGSFAVQLHRDCRHFRYTDAEARADAVVLAVRLASVGYAVSVRTALGPAPQQAAVFKNLRHEFLCVQGSGDYEGVEFVVEPHFKEQFTIPQPSSEYLEVLSSLPEEFVGTAARLVPIVQILCCEMAASFASRDLTLPPWRRERSLISKWMPERIRDTPVSGSSEYASSNEDSQGSGASPVMGSSPLASLSPNQPSPQQLAAMLSPQQRLLPCSTTLQLCSNDPSAVSPLGRKGARRQSMLSLKLLEAVPPVTACPGPMQWDSLELPRIHTVRPGSSSQPQA